MGDDLAWDTGAALRDGQPAAKIRSGETGASVPPLAGLVEAV